MKRLAVTFVFVILALGFNACEKYVIELDEVGVVSFSTDIQSIFVAKCANCHPPTAGLDLNDGNVYASLTTHKGGSLIDTATPEDSPLYTKILGGHGSLTTNDINKILQWIKQGAKND